MPHAPTHAQSAARRRRMADLVVLSGSKPRGVAVLFGVGVTTVYESVYACYGARHMRERASPQTKNPAARAFGP